MLKLGPDSHGRRQSTSRQYSTQSNLRRARDGRSIQTNAATWKAGSPGALFLLRAFENRRTRVTPMLHECYAEKTGSTPRTSYTCFSSSCADCGYDLSSGGMPWAHCICRSSAKPRQAVGPLLKHIVRPETSVSFFARR